MLRTTFLALILIISSSSSTSLLRKSLVRRQTDPQYCHALEGFECKCSYYRVTCTTEREFPSPINVLPNERNKYESVELVISAARDINVNDQTFAPVKDLFKPDGHNYEFRIKFEKFTALHLTSPGVFNRVYPDNTPANARKTLALEIYNPDVPPSDHPNLFKNLNADTVELYALYPFKGSFQQLFDGANIKYLRLSGGEIRSDVSQSFTGNIGRLELAKQASELSVQNFPVYPAHELTINAFYVDDFNSQHPPNYNNLGELRVHSNNRIPANAFQNYPNIHTLQISTEQDIDPQAFNGLNNLEKLIIKDTKLPVDALKNLPNLKEYETNIEKLDEKSQCQLLEKLASGQLAVQAIPNGRECTCVSAYLESALGRTPCEAENCDRSTCAAIKNNYNAQTRTFNAPPTIRRADGSDALRPREPKVYSSSSQIASQDQQKLHNGAPQQPPREEPPRYDENQGQGQQYPSDTQGSHWGYDRGQYDQQQNENYDRYDHNQHNTDHYHPYTESPSRDDHVHHDQDSNRQDHDQDANHHDHDSHQHDQDSNRQNHEQDGNRHDHGQYTETPSGYDENSYRDNDAHYHDNSHRNDDVSHTESPNVDNENFNRNDQSSFSENNHNEHNYPSHNNNEENFFNNDDNAPLTTTIPTNFGWDQDLTTTTPYFYDDQQGQNQETGDGGQTNEGGDNQQPGDGNENQGEGNENQGEGGETATIPDDAYMDNSSSVNGTDTAIPPKKGMSWLPIIIIAAAIVALLLIGLLVLFLRKKKNGNANKDGYRAAAQQEQAR